jgi:hypothetical protein
MTVQLDHTIVPARDKKESASFLAEILGLPEPVPTGPFMAVQIDHDLSIDFADTDGDIPGHSTTRSGSARTSSTRSSLASGSAHSPTGPILVAADPARSPNEAADAASTSKTPVATSSRSSPVRTLDDTRSRVTA